MTESLRQYTAQELAVALMEKITHGDHRFLRSDTSTRLSELLTALVNQRNSLIFPEVG